MRGGFFAGLVAGEGSFAVHPYNGGQSWQCFFGLGMRADDTQLVQDLQEFAGCGQLYPRQARGRSKPQVLWQVSRTSECHSLAELLAQHPLLNKKTGDVRLWTEAVDVWQSGGASRWERMAAIDCALREHRDWRTKFDPPAVDISRPYLDAFLSGFATAEAHFGTTLPAAAPVFRINLRADDRAILDLFASVYGVGRVFEHVSHGRRPVASWIVTGCDPLLSLAETLDRVPPLGRQGRVYRAWRELLDVAAEQRGRRHSATEKLQRRELAWFVRTQRAYSQPAPLPRRDRSQEARDRCLAALRAWAEASPPSFTATAYELARAGHDWPKRNTIARVFGSWRAGLEAAGLPTTDCHSRQRASAIGANARAGAAEARETTRRKVVEAARRCADDLKRQPRALEFFRWRLEHAPGTPSQMTLYRAFPGGWAEVMEAAGAATA